MQKDEILKKLDGTITEERIIQVMKLYDKLEKKQEKFCDKFDIHCCEGCGSCCEHFTPDINEVEALFLAYGLIKENRDQEVLELLHSKNMDEEHYCPLYRENNPFHCSVYKYRPLICRLFGASASHDKEGKCVFKKCKFNSIGHDVDDETFKKHKSALVLMSDYGETINQIAPNDLDRELLPYALEKAIDKIRFYLELKDDESK